MVGVAGFILGVFLSKKRVKELQGDKEDKERRKDTRGNKTRNTRVTTTNIKNNKLLPFSLRLFTTNFGQRRSKK